jgi:hypothetical protein
MACAGGPQLDSSGWQNGQTLPGKRLQGLPRENFCMEEAETLRHMN